MKARMIQLSIMAFLVAAVAQAQNIKIEKEKELIEEKINMYFEGWMTGDTTKIGKAMHTTCKLKNLKDGGVIVYDRETYLGFFKPRARRKNSEGKIVQIDVTGNIAAAKCEIETPTHLSTDYFNLMKVNNEWFIVDKIATSREKGQ